MEFALRVFASLFLIIQIQTGHVASESQDVIFEVKDGELNQVIFTGEENITLICHVSNTLHADVTINKIGGDSVASNSAVGNCVEYTIPEITERSDLDYSCMARYRNGNTDRIVQMSKLLSLNVTNTARAVCFRNGSVSKEEYTEGDTLLLSCYCINYLECFWGETVVGSELGFSVQNTYEYQHNNKSLLQIVVGPLNSTDVSLRYDCVHGSHSDERCSIGPANVSMNDIVLQPIPVSDHAEGCPTMVTPITGTIPEAMSFTTDQMTVGHFTTGNKVKLTAQYNLGADERDDSTMFILIIVAGMLMLLVVALLLLFLLIRKNKGGKTDQCDDKGAEEKQVRNSQDHKEDIYAEPRKKHVNGDYLSKAIKVEADDAGDEGEELCMPEVSEYGIPMALRRDAIAEKDHVDEGEVFCIPDVSEYDIPMALRRNGCGC